MIFLRSPGMPTRASAEGLARPTAEMLMLVVLALIFAPSWRCWRRFEFTLAALRLRRDIQRMIEDRFILERAKARAARLPQLPDGTVDVTRLTPDEQKIVALVMECRPVLKPTLGVVALSLLFEVMR